MKYLATIGIFLGVIAALQGSPIQSEVQYFPPPSELVDPLIENGIPAGPGNFPHHVTLLVLKNQTWVLISGVLVAEDWVLTVSHPTTNAQQIRIYHGSNKLNSTKVAYASRVVRKGHLALIQLFEAITFDRFTTPALLPEDEIEENTDFILTGFGSKSIV